MAESHFTHAELACRCCGENRMHPDFMARLERLRTDYGKPMPLTSAYRCPAHDQAVGGMGPHQTGHAVDVAVQGHGAFALVAAAMALGFTGIGVSQKGAARFIHLDDLTGPSRPRIWSY